MKTLGLAVINHEVIDALNSGNTDIDKTEEEIQAEIEARENTEKNAKALALYAMVEDASIAYCGELGYKVPALKSANTMKFWREFPSPVRIHRYFLSIQIMIIQPFLRLL